MKRVLIFSTAYFPFVGGAEVAVKEITDRLTDFEFVMITAKMDAKLSDEEKIGNIEVYRVGKGDKWDKLRLIWLGPKKAESLGFFDVVWGIIASYAGFAAMRYKKRNKKSFFVLTLQEGDSFAHIYSRVWWCWPYFKQIFKKADRVQAISNYLAEWARKMGVKKLIEVVPNGVNLKKFQSDDPEVVVASRESVVKELGLPDNVKIIITASRLVKKNGIEYLIRALKFLPHQAHLLILGEGNLRDYLEILTGGQGLDWRVHFLGEKNHEKLSRYLWSADVFCRPSLTEGLGNAFLEAMAAGLPVVATPVGGIPDFLRDGETGLFCAPKNPEDTAEKIKKILSDETLKNKLITNGVRMIQEKYTWEKISEKMDKILKGL